MMRSPARAEGGAAAGRRADPPEAAARSAGGPAAVRVLLALVRKDLVTEARTRELLTSMSLLAFLALIVQSLAVGLRPAPAVTAAVLWITVAFAATLLLARAHTLERESGALQGMLLTPAGRGVLYLGKCAASMILVLILEAVVLLGAAVLLDADLARSAGLVAVPLALGAVGFCAAGTLLGTMAASTRLRELLLPVLLLPVALPLVTAALAGTRAALEGAGAAAVWGPARFLVAFDVIFLVLGTWLFEYAVEE